MHKIALAAASAPPPSAHLSCAVLSEDAGVVFVSGALGIKCGKFIEGTVADRFHQAISNVSALLAEASSALSDGKSPKDATDYKVPSGWSDHRAH